jgi:predicted restriction endonuclease
VSWSEVLDQTSTTSRLNAAPVRFGDSDDEVWLWSVFSRSTRPDLQYPEVEAELEGDDVDWERDDRKRQERAIAIRLGQRGFRARLVAAYAGRCAVTGYSALAALEAAHIAPYRGEHSHDVRNGLLLRADIHTLFDLKLLTVTPDWIIHVSQELSDSEYWSLDGKRMAVVPSHEDAPLPDLLAVHNDSFGLARS